MAWRLEPFYELVANFPELEARQLGRNGHPHLVFQQATSGQVLAKDAG